LTISEYFQILVDTLLGRMIEPFKKRPDRQTITKAPKFYLFDVGVAGALTGRQITAAKGEQFGEALEHFVLMELVAHRAYREIDYDTAYWRTRSGPRGRFRARWGRGRHRGQGREPCRRA
jgi:predicted AAA+ superfamily ATPase